MKSVCERFGLFTQSLKPVVALTIGALMLIAFACGGSGGGPIAASSTGSVVFGGSQPVVGALVTLYEAGTAGYGSEPLILASATSGAGGRFPSLSFTCSSAASELYIVADGGNGGGGTNNKISLMAALGRCDSLPSFVVINEVTTVVSTYALAQFMSTINPE